MTTIQEQVAQAVAARGYREGWTAEQFAARQVAKLQEELGELVRHIDARADEKAEWEVLASVAGRLARSAFDASKNDWMDAYVYGAHCARWELADIQVVVFALAAALSEIDGEPFDLAQAALDKATEDVDRGVRK